MRYSTAVPLRFHEMVRTVLTNLRSMVNGRWIRYKNNVLADTPSVVVMEREISNILNQPDFSLKDQFANKTVATVEQFASEGN